MANFTPRGQYALSPPAALTQPDLLGTRKTAAIVPPGGVPAPGVGPRSVSFTQARPDEGRMTLSALMAQKKDAALRQQEALGTPQGTIAGGIGQVLTSFLEGRKQYQAEQEEATGREEITQAMLGINPETGVATPEQLATIMRRDPDLGLALYQEAMEARRAAAKAEDWEDMTAPEGAQPGSIYQRNRITGEVREVGGASGTTVNVGGEGTKKRAQTLAEKFAERESAYSAEGLEARRQKLQIGQLKDLMVDMPTGLDAKATQWLRENWGVSLGEGADKLQAFNAIISKMVPSQRPAGAGPMSDKDIDLFRGSLPDYMGSPEGNAMVLSTMDAIADYNVALGAIADQTAQIEDDKEAMRVFKAEVDKLPDPLAAWRAAQSRRKPAATTPTEPDDDLIVEPED